MIGVIGGRARWLVWRMTFAGALTLWLLVGLAPFLSVAHADGGAPNLSYIVGGGASADNLTIIDIAGRKIAATVPIGGEPRAVALSVDARYAYVTESARNAVAVVDASSRTVTAAIPTGAKPAGLLLDTTTTAARLLVANSGADTVSVLNPDARTTTATIQVGQHPTAVALAGPANELPNAGKPEYYVTNSDADSVSVIDASSLKVVATVPVSGGPITVMIPQSGGVAYVGTRAGAIVAIRLVDRQPLGTVFQLKGAPGQMDYNAISGSIYVPDPAGNAVQVLRPVSSGAAGSSPSLPDEPVRTLPFSNAPSAVAIPADGTFGMVAEDSPGKATMLDLSTRQTLATFDVGGKPVAVITGPNPPLLDRQTGVIVGFVLTGAMLIALGVVGYFFLRSDRRNEAKAAAKAKAEQAQSQDNDA
ncbi:MAG TPA: YncE family protein [Ktedonobacterales bacterium]|nr:YncE family protein [Ktedonobacterales bacterium]